jgi:hypothetical protein
MFDQVHYWEPYNFTLKFIIKRDGLTYFEHYCTNNLG